MIDWSVRLVGDEFELEELPSHFDSPELFIYSEEDKYYMKSDEFESVEDTGRVRSLALDNLNIINGALKLINPSFNSIGIQEIIQPNEKGGRNLTVTLKETVRLRDKVNIKITDENGSISKYFHSIKGSECAEAAEKNEDIKLAISLFSTDMLSWDILFKIYEFIEINNGKATIKNWTTKDECELFSWTYNSYAALGIKARHMKNKNKSPDNPMTFSEANKLIEKLLIHWIQKEIKN